MEISESEKLAGEPGRSADLADTKYLQQIEGLAQELYVAAVEEIGSAKLHTREKQTRLEQAISELVSNVRRYHHAGDGCVD